MTPQEHKTMSKCDWHGGTYAGRKRVVVSKLSVPKRARRLCFRKIRLLIMMYCDGRSPSPFREFATQGRPLQSYGRLTSLRYAQLVTLPTLWREFCSKRYSIVLNFIPQHSEPKQKDHRLMVFLFCFSNACSHQ